MSFFPSAQEMMTSLYFAAYHMAGHDVEALQVLEQLMENAVRENRFVDAAYYNWMLSMQYLERYNGDPEFNEKFLDFNNKANCYYAFDVIHKYLVMINMN